MCFLSKKGGGRFRLFKNQSLRKLAKWGAITQQPPSSFMLLLWPHQRKIVIYCRRSQVKFFMVSRNGGFPIRLVYLYWMTKCIQIIRIFLICNCWKEDVLSVKLPHTSTSAHKPGAVSTEEQDQMYGPGVHSFVPGSYEGFHKQ